MFKTNQSNISVMARKTSTNPLSTTRMNQIQLPCPQHPQYPISHICLQAACSQSISFCSECLFDSQQQQHIAKHKEHVIGWQDFIVLCRNQSVAGRLGDVMGDSQKSKDVMNLVVQTQVHQQQFKQHMRAQEQLINQDFDKLIQQFTSDVTQLKNDLLAQYRLYYQELQDMGKVVEKMIQEYYQNKGESKDYNNDFDNFLKEIIKIQDEIQQKEQKTLRQSINQIPQSPTNQIQFNLKKLMQNILPLLSRATASFQKTILTQMEGGNDNQSSVSGLSLFSSFSMKNSENNILTDVINEYKNLLENRPNYKNQGIAQQAYLQAIEQLQKIYHNLNEQVENFVIPQFKSVFKNFKSQNKENTSIDLTMTKTRIFNSPLRQSLQNQNQGQNNASSAKKAATSVDKSQVYIDNYIKQQQTKQLKSVSKQGQSQLDLTEQNDDYQEQKTKQQNLKAINNGQIKLENEDQIIQFISVDHKKTLNTSHKGGINCLQMIDDEHIATGSNDKTVKIWRYANLELVKEIQFKSDITALSTLMRSDGSSMLIVGLYRQICLLNQSFEIMKYFETQPSFIDKESQLSTPKLVTFNLTDNQNQQQQVVHQTVHNGQINAILSIQDGQTILSCAQGDNKLVQWNVMDSQSLPKKYFEHRDAITCLTFVNGNTQVGSAGKDRNIKIYNLMFNEKEFKNGCLEKLQLSLSIQDAHPTEITALTSTPQPSLILSMSSTGEIKMWDSGDGQLIRTVKNYSGWGYKMIYLYQTIPNLVENKPLRRALSPTNRREAKENTKQLQLQHQNMFKQSHLLTFSFDGTMKLFNCSQFLIENSTSTYEPVVETKTKSNLECHPFGGVVALKDSSDKVQILTTGNRNDTAIQIYGLREL